MERGNPENPRFPVFPLKNMRLMGPGKPEILGFDFKSCLIFGRCFSETNLLHHVLIVVPIDFESMIVPFIVAAVLYASTYIL